MAKKQQVKAKLQIMPDTPVVRQEVEYDIEIPDCIKKLIELKLETDIPSKIHIKGKNVSYISKEFALPLLRLCRLFTGDNVDRMGDKIYSEAELCEMLTENSELLDLLNMFRNQSVLASDGLFLIGSDVDKLCGTVPAFRQFYDNLIEQTRKRSEMIDDGVPDEDAEDEEDEEDDMEEDENPEELEPIPEQDDEVSTGKKDIEPVLPKGVKVKENKKVETEVVKNPYPKEKESMDDIKKKAVTV